MVVCADLGPRRSPVRKGDASIVCDSASLWLDHRGLPPPFVVPLVASWLDGCGGGADIARYAHDHHAQSHHRAGAPQGSGRAAVCPALRADLPMMIQPRMDSGASI